MSNNAKTAKALALITAPVPTMQDVLNAINAQTEAIRALAGAVASKPSKTENIATAETSPAAYIDAQFVGHRKPASNGKGLGSLSHAVKVELSNGKTLAVGAGKWDKGFDAAGYGDMKRSLTAILATGVRIVKVTASN